MKKIMASAVFLLPLIVLLIMLISSTAVGLVSHIYVEALEFVGPETIELVMNDESNPPSQSLNVNVLPMQAKNTKLIYTSQDENIVTVDEKGIVTAVDFGATTITVQSEENRAASVTCNVVVLDYVVHRFEFNKYPQEMFAGESFIFSANIIPLQAENKHVIWESSDDDILSINSAGEGKCFDCGEVTITIRSEENSLIYKSIQLTCYNILEEIDTGISNVKTVLDNAKFPEIIFTPTGAKLSEVTYSSENTDIAIVDASGNISFKTPGKVKIKASVTDLHTNQVFYKEVEYSYTGGYYDAGGYLFENTSYTFDFDEYYQNGKILPINILQSSDEYQKILKVTFNIDNILSFDMATKKFAVIGEMPVGKDSVDVTIHAEKYDSYTGKLKEYDTDKCRIYFKRNVSSIKFVDKTGTTVSEISTTLDNISLNPLVLPLNHTNKLVYSLVSFTADDEQDNSQVPIIADNGLLQFKTYGTAIVKLEALDDNNKKVLETQVAVKYQFVPLTDVIINLNEAKTVDVILDFNSETSNSKAHIIYNKPANAQISFNITKGDEVVEVINQTSSPIIQAKKGGFAQVVLTAQFDDGRVDSYTMNMYVDKHISAQNLQFSFKNNLVTSREYYEFNVHVDVADDFMEGKQVFFKYSDGKEIKAQTQDNLTFFGTVPFTASGTVQVTAIIRYAENVPNKNQEIVTSLSNNIISTYGTLTSAPTITMGDVVLSTQQNLQVVISDIGEFVTLNIDTSSFIPADFELSKHKPNIPSTNIFSASIINDGDIIKLYGLSATNGNSVITNLIIGGYTFKIEITVEAKAQKISVRYDNMQLSSTTSYTTLLNSLNFNVTLSRNDNQNITYQNIIWQTNIYPNGQEVDLSNGSFNVPIENNTNYIIFTVANNTSVAFKIFLNKLSNFSDFSATLSFKEVLGSVQTLGNISSFKNFKNVEYILPNGTQGTVSLKINISQNLLGGVGDKSFFENLFKIEKTALRWSSQHDQTTATIIFTIDPILREDSCTYTITQGDITKSITIRCSRISNINFDGFDMSLSKNLFLGYQQVRVFAKKSYYNGKDVDYFKIPVEVNSKASVSDLNWVLKTSDGVILASQQGTVVTYGNKLYNIVVNNGVTLKDENGNVVTTSDGKNSGNICWVDTYSEPGYARIYFGSFNGLTESDVQNSYFGNFGEEINWSKPKVLIDDNSGRTFAPSANAFKFLTVEANDGAKVGGVSRHFNFNVIEGNDLFNIFDAKGYYAKEKIVLHTNLYGPDELNGSYLASEALEKDLYLNDVNLTKPIIYGNGFQINMEVKNRALLEANKTDKVGESGGVAFGNLYNVVLKGSNPQDEISRKKQVVVFSIKSTYYCQVEYFSKINGGALSAYFVNSTFYGASRSTFQLYRKDSSVYLNNVVIVEGGVSISIEKFENQSVCIKGFFEVLNYNNEEGIKKLVNMDALSFVSDIVVDKVLGDIEDYKEWFGSKPNSQNQFGNILMVSNILGKFKIFDKNSNQYVDCGTEGKLENNETIKQILHYEMFSYKYYAWTYNCSNTIDGAHIKHNWWGTTDISRDYSSLFTENRYLRLLCQYKTISNNKLVRNDSHILWHMQKVYRDMSKISGRTENHIDDLVSSLKGVVWPDGSTSSQAYDYSKVYATNVTAILPKKKEQF